jgi:hypothetical protein
VLPRAVQNSRGSIGWRLLEGFDQGSGNAFDIAGGVRASFKPAGLNGGRESVGPLSFFGSLTMVLVGRSVRVYTRCAADSYLDSDSLATRVANRLSPSGA